MVRMRGCSLAIMFVVLVVAGCASKPETKVVNATPQGIAIEHERKYASYAGVVADEHCAQFDKTAEYLKSQPPEGIDGLLDSEAEISLFRCAGATTTQSL